MACRLLAIRVWSVLLAGGGISRLGYSQNSTYVLFEARGHPVSVGHVASFLIQGEPLCFMVEIARVVDTVPEGVGRCVLVVTVKAIHVICLLESGEGFFLVSV